MEILAVDYKNDIVLLGKEFIRYQQNIIPVFDYPLGSAKKLEWGSFVYMVGFPKGHQMITKGIVSQPNRDKKGSFLVDALFNKGFSGGIVLAIRDGVPNFELVGMAGSVSADVNYLMVPPANIKEREFDPRIPYNDNIFVKADRTINYGITFIISSEIIREFLLKNKEGVLERGFSLGDFLD